MQSSQELNELLEKQGAADISSQDSIEQPLSNEVQHLNSPQDGIGLAHTSTKIACVMVPISAAMAMRAKHL